MRRYQWREPSGWRKTRAYILLRDGGTCWVCGKGGADSVDHVLPRARGGGEDESNLRAAHMICNIMRTRHMKRRGAKRIGGAPHARAPRW